jgi:hypothetical protein
MGPNNQRLKLNEAINLFRDRFGIAAGEAQGAVWQAIASREICCAWTEAAIVNKERQAPRAVGRSFDARHSAGQHAAYARAVSRLRLLTEIESSAFKDEVIVGNIVFDEADLLSWYEREGRSVPRVKTVRPAPKGKAGRREAHDWDALKERFFALMRERGDFRQPDQMEDWNSQAAAARTLLDSIPSDKKPDQKTVEHYIRRWIEEAGGA